MLPFLPSPSNEYPETPLDDQADGDEKDADKCHHNVQTWPRFVQLLFAHLSCATGGEERQ